MSTEYVGKGLKDRSYEEALAEGLNPNPNPTGEFPKFTRASMKKHIKNAMPRVIAALKKI